MFTKFVYYACKTIMKVPLYVFTFALSVLIQITIILPTYCVYKNKFNLRLIIIYIRNINNDNIYIYIFFFFIIIMLKYIIYMFKKKYFLHCIQFVL